MEIKPKKFDFGVFFMSVFVGLIAGMLFVSVPVSSGSDTWICWLVFIVGFLLGAYATARWTRDAEQSDGMHAD